MVWKGQQFVKATGEHRYQIPPQAAETLLSKFRTSEVWSLCESYSRSITDNPSTVVDIEIGGGRKHILDYAASSPPWFQLLQGEIDAIGLTHDRRHGDAATEPQGNIREEYLPKPGMTPLMESAARGEIQTVRKLIAEGADLNAADSSGWTALMYAAGAYSAAEAIDALLKAGADASLRDRQGRQAFQFVTEPARSEIEMKWSRRTLESAVKQKR